MMGFRQYISALDEAKKAPSKKSAFPLASDFPLFSKHIEESGAYTASQVATSFEKSLKRNAKIYDEYGGITDTIITSLGKLLTTQYQGYAFDYFVVVNARDLMKSVSKQEKDAFLKEYEVESPYGEDEPKWLQTNTWNKYVKPHLTKDFKTDFFNEIMKVPNSTGKKLVDEAFNKTLAEYKRFAQAINSLGSSEDSPESKVLEYGTCPVCQGEYKVRKDKMVAHGYTAPRDFGYGGRSASCFGHGLTALEISSDGIDTYIKHLQDQIDSAPKQIAAVKKAKSFTINVRRNFKDITLTVEKGTPDYTKYLPEKIRQIESEVEASKKELTFIKKEKDKWEKTRKKAK